MRSNPPPPPFPPAAWGTRTRYAVCALPWVLLGLLASPAAVAERADRTKPLTIDADKSGTFDLGKKIVTYVGNVVVTQGTLAIRAEKVEVRQLGEGRVATAFGVAGRPATFRQKREGLDETIEGTAERIEYDDRSDTVRFVGAAGVRRLRGAATADEITGGLITYDNRSEIFVVQGKPGAVSQPGRDRVRAVFTPQPEPRDTKDKAAPPPVPADPAASSVR